MPESICFYLNILAIWKQKWKGSLGYGVERHIQQYYSYIVAVSFISGENRNARRIPPTYGKSLTNLYRVHLAWADLITLVVIGTDCTGSCTSNLIFIWFISLDVIESIPM